jgi:hypothetical protein
VLTSGGYVLVGFIDRESSLGKVYETRKQDNEFYQDATFLSVNEVVYHLKQAGFRDLVFRQTIFQNPEEMKRPDPVRSGYGEGSFVVVRAKKPFKH